MTAAINAFLGWFRTLGDITLWRSLGWIVLGLVLMLIGITRLIGGKLPPFIPVPL